MKVAVASGKGGTGKTTVAVNLALSVPGAHLVDCDVEAPNCHLLLGMAPQPIAEVTMSSPAIDDDLCILCGDCASFCQFNALAVLPDRVLTFEHLCHACGGCALVCPVDAISELPRVVGQVQHAQQAELVLHQGLLEIGQASAVAVIAAVKREAERAHQSGLLIYDAPPGAACPALETVRGCDYVILVTEPTPFGLHDLRLAVAAMRHVGVPVGVVINRDGSGDDEVTRYCRAEGLQILLRIPHDRRIAELYSQGTPFATVLDGWAQKFAELGDRIREEVPACASLR